MRPEKAGEPRIDGALYFMYYKFARVHQTLRITPPTEAGVSDHVWSVEKSSSCVSNREQAYAVSATSDPSIHHHRSGGARVTICRGLGQSFSDGP